MLSNFMKSSKTKQKQKVASHSSNSTPYSTHEYVDSQQNNRYLTTGMTPLNTPISNFEINSTNFDINSPHSPLHINTNNLNNNFDIQQSPTPYINDDYDYYSSNYNQSSNATPSSSKTSSGSTTKLNSSNQFSNYNVRSTDYGSNRAVRYNEMNQNDIPSSSIIKSKNTTTSSHPLPSSTKYNLKELQSPPPRTVSNNHTHRITRTSSSNYESNNRYLSPKIESSRSNELSTNTLELYDLYSSAAAYVNSTSPECTPRILDNFRSLSRNFKMKEFSTNSPSLSSSRAIDNDESDLMSTVLNAGMHSDTDDSDDSDDSDNEPLFNTYYRNRNKKLSNPPSISSNSQNSNAYRNGYYGSNSSLSTNLSNSNNVTKTSQVKKQVGTTSSGINRRISRSQPNMALPSTSIASKAYASMLRNYKYSSSSKTPTSSSNPSGNFTNVQELQPIAGSQKPSRKDIQRGQPMSNTSPRFTPPLSYTQVNTQTDSASIPEHPQYQAPIIMGKRKQSLGSNTKFKDYHKNSTTPTSTPITPIYTRNHYTLSQSSGSERQHSKINDKDTSSSSSRESSQSEIKQPLQQQTKPLSPQLKLLRHLSQSPILKPQTLSSSPVLKHQTLSASPQLAASCEKPLPPSPLLTQKRNSLSSPINNQKPLPTPLITQKLQPLASPQLATQSPLQTYVTLDNSSSSSETSSLKYHVPSISSSVDDNSKKRDSIKSQTPSKKRDSLTSSPAFANADVIGDKIISPIPINANSSNTPNVFTHMQNQAQASSPIVNYTSVGSRSPLLTPTKRISSPKLLNNPFVKKDQELQQQQQQLFYNHMNHSSPNLSSPTTTSSPKVVPPKMNSPKMNSPKMTSPKLNTTVVSSPRISSSIVTSPKMMSSKLASPRLGYGTTNKNSSRSSNNPMLSNEVLSRNSHPEMPMNSFNYKSLARTPPITYAASITNSPTLSVHSVQSTPKASSSVAVIPPVQDDNQINNCTINKRVSSYHIEHQLKEQLQEQIQNGNSSVKSSKYDEFYTLPSGSSVSSTSPHLYAHSNTSNNSLNVPIDNRISPKLQSAVTALTPIQQPTTPYTGPENNVKNKNYSSLDRSKHIRHKRNVSFNDDKNQIIEGKDKNELGHGNNSTVSNASYGNVSGQSSNTNVSSSTAPEDERIFNSYSSYPETTTNLTLQVENDEIPFGGNYISQAKSVKVSSNKHPVSHMKKLSSPSPILKEKEQNNKNNEGRTPKKLINKLSVENVSYGSNSSNGSAELINNYNGDINGNMQYSKRTLGRYNERTVEKVNLNNDDIDGKQFYVKNYRKLNSKELSYLQEVSYKQLKQNFPETTSFIKKDVLKALQQKAKNKNGSAPKWWSYWKKESKNSMSCSVFKTPLNTSILYASVSLDSTDEENPRVIPIVVYKCVQYLKKFGLKKEGIFRVNGNERRIQASVKSFDEPPYLGPDTFENLNVYDIAGLLKLYIRSLPDSLFPNEIYLPLLKYYDRYGDENDRIKIIQLFLMMLPRNNLILLEYLFDLFNLVTKFSEYNQMNSGNLARVFAPNLLKPANGEPSLKDYEITTSIIKFIIDHDPEFHISRSDNILLKILQEVPDFNSKNYKAKKNNLHIPFMALNNIFSDSEETDDERSSRYSNSTNGDYMVSKYSPQLANGNNQKFSPILTSDEKSNGKNTLVSNNLNVKINKNPAKTTFNSAALLLTPPQSPSSPTQSAAHPNIKSQLNAITTGNDMNMIQSTNTKPIESSNEDKRSFNVQNFSRKESTSFSVMRPNLNMSNSSQNTISSNTTMIPPMNKVACPENIIRSGSVNRGRGDVQRSNSKTIVRKNTIEEGDNSSRSPSNDMSIERNNSKKIRQNASEI